MMMKQLIRILNLSLLLQFTFIHLSAGAIKYPNKVCVTGDVQADYDSTRDPRTLMGTYTSITTDPQVDTQIVDTSAPIYQHFFWGNDTGETGQTVFLFKVVDPNGWALSETLPEVGNTVTVFLTCFEDSLFDCNFNKWFWGYNKYEHKVETMQVLGGECHGNMCLKNLTIQLRNQTSEPPITGDFSKLDGEFYRVWDNSTNRYQWKSRRSDDFRWFYRINAQSSTHNWVYQEDGTDRIACAPGWVEMPLWCTTFVYAGAFVFPNSTKAPISYNPTLPRDRLGIPLWAATEGDQITTFKMGVCGETMDPTVEPTMEPSAPPTLTPTDKPTATPKCPKDYIFEASDAENTVTKECPFGWLGSGITRYCHVGGEWETEDDDCFLISFSDDFTYFRDELWKDTTGYEGSLEADVFDSDSPISSLTSYPSFKGPFKIQFSAISNASFCGGYDFKFVDEVLNTTDGDLRVYWDCANAVAHLDAKQASAAATATDESIDGYILYREDSDTHPTLIVKGLQSASIAQVTDINGSFIDSQPFVFGLYHNNATAKRIQWKQLTFTSFVDWFSSQRDLWTTFPSDYFITNYTTAFTAIDPIADSTFIEFESPHILQSDDTQFQFASPFTVSLVYGVHSFSPNHVANVTNDRTSQFSIILETSTTRRNPFEDTSTYPSRTLTIEFTDDELSIEAEAVDLPVFNDTLCDKELFVQISVAESNISVVVYNTDMATICGELTLEDTSDIDQSSYHWDSFSIQPNDGSFLSLSYIDVTSGALTNIETSAPSSSPTMAPTISCVYGEEYLEFNDTITRECEFGYAGSGDTATCEEDGEIGEWTQGCFIISFSDEFDDFDESKWHVHSTEGVSGQAAMALDGTPSLRFIPQEPALVAVIRSQERIVWPMRMQATIEKRSDECNLWAVGLGPSWLTRTPFSTRVNWGCFGGNNHKQMSLYNHTFRLYDSKCWSDADDDTMMMTFSVRDAQDNPGAEMSAGSDCATLDLQVIDILSQNPWEDAYLWLGSYAEVEDTDLKDYLNDSISVVGRFQSVQYTTFYSEFNRNMIHIWDENQTTATEASNQMLIAPGEIAVADPDLFQFTLPFKVKLEIKKPSLEDEVGHYAHFVSFGATSYVEDSTADVVQIVWDGNKKVRLIYTADQIYQTGMNNEEVEEDEYYCNWDTTKNSRELVMIYVDETKITVIDELCNENNMTATHGLESNEISTFSLGFIRPQYNNYDEELDRIAFTLIEVYQYPVSYAGEIADDNADSDILADLTDIYPPKVSNNTILGFEPMMFIIGVCCAVLLCCVCYCAIAFKARCFPFRSKKPKADVGSSLDPPKPPNEKRSIKNAQGNTNKVQRMESHSENNASQPPNPLVGNSNDVQLQQKLIQREDPNQNAYNNNNFNMQQAQSPRMGQQMSPQMGQQMGMQQQMSMGQQMGMGMNQQMGMQQQQQMGMGMGQQMGMQMDQQALQYQMYQQQLFYQQQFMQMMMTNPQQQAILQSMNPMQRKHYIHSQMMIYMSRITAMQQQNMIPQPVMQMQQQYMQSNPGGSGEGGEGGGGGGNTGFMEGGGLSTNALVNMSYGNNPLMGDVEMQSVAQNVNILNEFCNAVPVEQFYQMCPVGQDGVPRSDANRARLMIAKFRGIPPTDVDQTDEAVAYFENLTLMELKSQLTSLPEAIYDVLKGDNYHPNVDYTNGVADFLVEFCEKVNLKQIYDDLSTQIQHQEPRLDSNHARTAVAHLRSTAYGQVSENDPGVRLIVGKNLVEMRFYLSNLPMPDLKLLDLKSYHRYMKGQGNARIPEAKQAVGGIVFPTINVNFNGDIRQFKPPKFGCFDEIIGFIKQQWPMLNVNQYKLMYQDVQAQWIRITTNIDVQECIKEAVQQKATHLNINIIT